MSCITYDKTSLSRESINPMEPIPSVNENYVFTIFAQMGTQFEIRKDTVSNILKNITENRDALLYAVLPTASASLGGTRRTHKKLKTNKKRRKTKRRKSRRH